MTCMIILKAIIKEYSICSFVSKVVVVFGEKIHIRGGIGKIYYYTVIWHIA